MTVLSIQVAVCFQSGERWFVVESGERVETHWREVVGERRLESGERLLVVCLQSKERPNSILP